MDVRYNLEENGWINWVCKMQIACMNIYATFYPGIPKGKLEKSGARGQQLIITYITTPQLILLLIQS